MAYLNETLNESLKGDEESQQLFLVALRNVADAQGGKKPNAVTMKAIKNIENGKNLTEATNTQDLFRKLGI